MTDVEFLERMRRELAEHPAQGDVRGAAGPGEDPVLAANELLTYPAAARTTAGKISRFRVLIEWEVGPDREFPQVHCRPSPDRQQTLAESPGACRPCDSTTHDISSLGFVLVGTGSVTIVGNQEYE